MATPELIQNTLNRLRDLYPMNELSNEQSAVQTFKTWARVLRDVPDNVIEEVLIEIESKHLKKPASNMLAFFNTRCRAIYKKPDLFANGSRASVRLSDMQIVINKLGTDYVEKFLREFFKTYIPDFDITRTGPKFWFSLTQDRRHMQICNNAVKELMAHV